jgi:hypothetical protein
MRPLQLMAADERRSSRSQYRRDMAKKKPQPEPIAKLYRVLSITRKRCEGLIARGEIARECFTETPRGLAVLDMPRAIKEGRAALEAKPLKAEADDSTMEGVDFDDPDTWPKDRDGLLVVTEHWRARLAKRKDDLAAGELLRAEEVRKHVFDLLRTTRDRLLKLPENVAADVSAALNVPDVNAVRDAMREGVERVLGDLSSSIGSIARAPTDDTAAA